MTQHQWEVVERTLAGFTVEEKREVAVRILESIRDEDRPDRRASQQREALERLCQSVDAIPEARPEDDLTNRDHDRIIYAR